MASRVYPDVTGNRKVGGGTTYLHSKVFLIAARPEADGRIGLSCFVFGLMTAKVPIAGGARLKPWLGKDTLDGDAIGARRTGGFCRSYIRAFATIQAIEFRDSRQQLGGGKGSQGPVPKRRRGIKASRPRGYPRRRTGPPLGIHWTRGNGGGACGECGIGPRFP